MLVSRLVMWWDQLLMLFFLVVPLPTHGWLVGTVWVPCSKAHSIWKIHVKCASRKMIETRLQLQLVDYSYGFAQKRRTHQNVHNEKLGVHWFPQPWYIVVLPIVLQRHIWSFLVVPRGLAHKKTTQKITKDCYFSLYLSLSFYIYICMYMYYMYMYMCIYIYIYIYVYIYMYTYIYIYIYVYIYTCIYIYICICRIHIYTYIYTYLHIYIYTYTYIYTYIYIHIHIYITLKISP